MRHLVSSLLFLAAALTAHGQDAAGTAEDVLMQADRAYAERRFEEAASGYQRFVNDFGQAPEAKLVIQRLRFPLAMSLIQCQKFTEALAEIALCLAGAPSPEQRAELLFWKGICELQASQPEVARDSLLAFAASYPASPRAGEAHLLIAATWLQQEMHAEAGTYLAEVRPRLAGEKRGRALVLELHARLHAGETATALALVREAFPMMDQLAQPVAFQMLTLELGSHLLEKAEWRSAIECLQRIWFAKRLIEHQRNRLREAEHSLAAAEVRADIVERFRLSQMTARMRRELGQFEKLSHFDSALRMRLAAAYQGMQRYREAAMILEAMLRDMPADPVVEEASVALAQCWMQAERWERVVQAGGLFSNRFAKSKHLPLVLYLAGTAEQKRGRFEEANRLYREVRTRFPSSDFAVRSEFMEGFTLLLADQPRPAGDVFAGFIREHSKHELWEAAHYWIGMAHSLDKQFERCRDAMREYAKRFPHGAFRGSVCFRLAYAAFGMRNFEAAITELEDYLSRFPDGEESSEALILLGDSLMNEGQMEKGIEVYKRIPQQHVRFFEEGWFKVGKALKLLERHDDLMRHMMEFRTRFAASSRLAEALYWIGWCHRQAGREEEARAIYWKAIEELGGDAGRRNVEDLFPALFRLYKGEETACVERLRDLRDRARADGRETLECRLLWAEGVAIRRTDPKRSAAILGEAACRLAPESANPMVLADCAESLFSERKDSEAERLFRELLKWNPRAPQKDRALAGLGFIESARGNDESALRWFERFAAEVQGSAVAARVGLARADLLQKRGDGEKAIAALEEVIKLPAARGEEKAEALCRIGELHLQAKRREKAFAYFQRTYVMYARWSKYSAQAYLRCGEILEALSDREGARRTYEEMLSRDDLAETREAGLARRRLESLRGMQG